jgi:hypothetical protein
MKTNNTCDEDMFFIPGIISVLNPPLEYSPVSLSFGEVDRYTKSTGIKSTGAPWR